MIERELIERNIKSFLYKHPAKPSSRSQCISVVVMALAIAALPALIGLGSFAPSTAHDDGGAASGNLSAQFGTSTSVVPKDQIFVKPVAGYVYDSLGSAVPGASVTVQMINITVKATLTTTTTAEGFYSVTFAPADWDVGNTIYVVATKAAQTGTNQSIAQDALEVPLQWVNVTLGVFIPEFSSYLPLVGGFVLIGALAVTASRSKDKGS